MERITFSAGKRSTPQSTRRAMRRNTVTALQKQKSYVVCGLLFLARLLVCGTPFRAKQSRFSLVMMIDGMKYSYLISLTLLSCFCFVVLAFAFLRHKVNSTPNISPLAWQFPASACVTWPSVGSRTLQALGLIYTLLLQFLLPDVDDVDQQSLEIINSF